MLLLRSTCLLLIAIAPALTFAQQTSSDRNGDLQRAPLSSQSLQPRGLDLALGADNCLTVTVPAGTPVVFWDRTGKSTAVTTSGRVSLQPGAYTVQTGNHFATCRIWAHQTAPPAAEETLPIVRGQNHHDWLWNMDKRVPGAIILTGIGLVIWGAATAS